MTISNCGHDENGKYSGGKAGDQSGTEWYLRGWYNAGWQAMYRHPDANVRAKISEFAVSAAKNDHIGYDQSQRETFWRELEKVGYDPARIATDCETDCSAGVAAIVKAVGYVLGIDKLKNVSIAMYTGNQDAVLVGAGFQRYTDSRYLTSDANLAAGDILRSGGHTTINVTGELTGIMTSGQTKSGPLDIDGIWGQATTKALQKSLGTTQDGIVSDQYAGYRASNPGLSAASWEWHSKTTLGSDMVRALQRKLGATVDGVAGPKTFRALQIRLGTYQDGVISNPSSCVKELQRRLNAGTF